MSSVDNRIVQMKFDNKQFEDGVKTTTKSLDDLKKGLNLEESAKSLSNLEKVGNNFSLAGIGAGVDAIASKFTALGIIGVTALVNITNQAVETGKRLISSLTIDPIRDGFADYNRKLTSVQTITNATGKSISEVTKYFDQLDTYADKTVYNLDDMTSAFAKFTNAGVSLDVSIPAIKGIANMTALAGQDANAAQIAFYNLSQSIAGGFLTTTDYKSLNLANVATKEWKEQMIQGAIAAGTLKKNSKNMYLIKGTKKAITESALFNEELSKGWATTSVLLDVLGKYGNEQTAIGKKALSAAQDIKSFGMMIDTLKASVGTGWTDTFEILIGNLDESKALFTPLTNTIGAFLTSISDARNKMLKFWKDNGGRAAILQSIVNSFEALKAILKPIGEAFREVFPPATGQLLVTISKALQTVTAHLKIGAETASVIKFVFKALFSVLEIGLKVVDFLAKAVWNLTKILVKHLAPVMDTISGYLSVAASYISNYVEWLSKSIDVTTTLSWVLDKLSTAFNFIKNVIANGLEAATPVVAKLKDAVFGLGDAFKNLFGGTKVYAGGLTEANTEMAKTESVASKVKAGFEKFHEILVKVWTVIGNIAKKVKEVLTPIIDGLKDKLSAMTFEDFTALLTGFGLLGLTRLFKKALLPVDDILVNFSKVLDQVGKTLKAFQKKVKADALLKIAIAVGILAAAVVVLSLIDVDKLAKSLGVITVVFTELVASLILIDKFVGKGIKGIVTMFALSTQMVALGIGIMLLAGALKILSSIEPEKLKQGTVALGALMTMLATFIKITKGGDLKASAGGLIGFGIGLLAITGALVILGKLKYEQLKQGTVAIAGLMTIIAAFVQLTRGGNLATSAGGLTGFAIGIAILSGALMVLGGLKYERLKQGMEAIAGLMGVIALFVNLTRGGDLAGSAGSLMGFATGILILSGALAILGKLEVGKLIQGGLAIALLMDVIAGFVNLTRGGDLATSAGGLIGFAVGIIIMTKALDILGKLETNKVIQGTLALAALINVIGVFVNVTRGGDLAASAAGMIGFAAGLIAISGAVYLLSLIKPDRITQGVVALASVMAMIALFIGLTKEGDLVKSAAGLTGFATGLMILAGVIAILSALNPEKLMMASTAIAVLMTSIALFVKMGKDASLMKSTVGFIAFAVGIGILAVSLGYLAQMDYKQLLAAGGAMTAVLLSIIAFVNFTSGADLAITAAGLVVFAGAIFIIGKVLTQLGSVDIKTLGLGIGALATILTVLGLTAFILTPLTPVILALSGAMALFGAGCLAVGLAMVLFGTGLTMLAETGSKAGEALTIVVKNIIGLIPLAMTTLAEGIIKFAVTIGNGAPIIADAFIKIFSSILDTISIMTPKVLSTIGTFIISLLDFIVTMVPYMVNAGMQLILGILTGISNNIGKITTAAIDIMLNFMDAVSSKLPEVIDTAFKVIIAFINGLAEAVRGNNKPLIAAVWNLISAIIDAITNFGGSFLTAGKNIVDGLISGMKAKITDAAKWAGNLASSILESAKKVLGIHSPSRAFAEIGRYSAEGFGIGLKKFGWMAEDEANTVGTNAMDSLRSAMANVSDAVSNNVDMNPTIRPVLDLSNIQNGSKQLDGMMSGYSISGSINKANMAAGAMGYNQSLASQSSGQRAGVTNQPISPVQQNTFNITGSNPKEIANEVSRILQKQVERRDIAWA